MLPQREHNKKNGIVRCTIKMLQEYQHSPGCLHHKLMQLKMRLEASWKEKPNRGARASPLQPSRAKLLPDPRGKEPAPGGLERAGPATRRIGGFPPPCAAGSNSSQVLTCSPSRAQARSALPLSRLRVAAGCLLMQAPPPTHKHTCTHNQIKGLIPSSSIILYFKNRIREGGLSKIQIS